MLCPLCEKPVKTSLEGVDKEGVLVYHLECLKRTPGIIEARKQAQLVQPERVSHDG